MINVDDRLIRQELKTIGVDAFAVLMCITSHLGKGSTAWPGVARLREMTGLSKERTYGAIKRLIDSSMVERWQENENGVWGKVVYRVTTSYLNIYVTASAFALVEEPLSEKPLSGNPEYGYPEYGNPETGNPAHISINKEEVLISTEVINKEEEREGAISEKETSPTVSQEYFAPDKHETTAAHIIEFLSDPANSRYLTGMSSGDWRRAVKGHCLKLQKTERWFELQVPSNEDEHYRWMSKRIAGIKSWYDTAAEIDRQSGRGSSMPPVIPSPPPNIAADSKPLQRASADFARKIAGR